MYSYEDRIRAVELYIKLGKRARPTLRQLGHPLVQRKADQDLARLPQPHRIPGEPWTCGIKPVRALIRTPLVGNVEKCESAGAVGAHR